MSFRHPVSIASIRVFPIRASGGVSPKMALGMMPTRPALLIKIEDTDGAYGWGEVWANFPPRANIHKAHIIEDVIEPKLVGQSFVEPAQINESLRKALSIFFLHVGQTQVFEHILAGIDTALWDLALRVQGQSFAEFMGLNDPVARSYATSINAEDLEEIIPKHAALGQDCFKLKIGFAEHGNRSIVEKASKLCPKGSKLMVDSNQSWSLDEAKDALGVLEDFAPFFAEESLASNAPKNEWEELARSTTIPLAGGENIYGIDEFLAMADVGMRVLQPDVAKWGGITGALDLAKVMPSGTVLWPHFMGTAVGQMAALSISAALGKSSACEVDVNANALRSELCGEIFDIGEGNISLVSEPGLVAPPLQAELKRTAEPGYS